MGLAERLRYARERAGLTQGQAGDRAAIGVSSVSEFENGVREPRISQIQALAGVYNRSLSFFLEEGPIPGEVVLWRKRPTEQAADIETAFLRHCEQYHNLELWCDERANPCLPAPPVRSADEFSYGDAESLAHRVRGDLHLGEYPAQELLRVLEEVCGVKVFHGAFEPTGTAASTLSDTFGPAILLNSNNVRWRRNFDLAHELFHLLTWSIFRTAAESAAPEPSEREEQLATCFARNLLMPREAVGSALNQHRRGSDEVPFEAVFDLARLFDVSVEALLWQMHFVAGRGPDDAERTKADIEKAKRLEPIRERWERKDTEAPEWPERYKALALKALWRGEISVGRFAEYLNMSRQKAWTYVEQGGDGGEALDTAPA